MFNRRIISEQNISTLFRSQVQFIKKVQKEIEEKHAENCHCRLKFYKAYSIYTVIAV